MSELCSRSRHLSPLTGGRGGRKKGKGEGRGGGGGGKEGRGGEEGRDCR